MRCVSALCASCVIAEGMCVDCRRVSNGCAQEIECEVYVRECTVQQKEMHRPTDKTEVSVLYEREVSVRCDREDVCKQREDICRQRSGNAQTTEVGALFKRAVSVFSAL